MYWYVSNFDGRTISDNDLDKLIAFLKKTEMGNVSVYKDSEYVGRYNGEAYYA